MVEFDKYEKNIMYAEAIQQVGSRMGYWLDDAKADIEHYTQRIKERIEENKETEDYNPDEDWTVRDNTRRKEVCESVLALYKKMQNVLDKEMSF